MLLGRPQARHPRPAVNDDQVEVAAYPVDLVDIFSQVLVGVAAATAGSPWLGRGDGGQTSIVTPGSASILGPIAVAMSSHAHGVNF